MNKVYLILTALIASACTVDAEFSGTTTEEFTREVLPSSLKFSGDDASSPSSCSDAISIEIRSEADNLTVATSSVSVSLQTSGSGQFYSDPGCVSPITQITISAGESSASIYYMDSTQGSYQFEASANSLSSATHDFSVAASGTPFKLAFAATIPDTTSMATLGGTSFKVQILDVDDVLVPTATDSVTISWDNQANPSANLGGTLTQIAATGEATFTLTIDLAANGYSLLASASGLVSSVSNSFNITPGAPASMAFTTQPPTNVTAGSGFGVAITVYDAQSNIVTTNTDNITVSIRTNPNSGTLSGTNVATVSSGVATFSGLSIDAAGSGYDLQVSGSGLLSGITPSPISNTFTIDPGSPYQLVYTTQPTSIASAGQILTTQPVVEVRDNLGNTVIAGSTTVTLTPYLDNTCNTTTAGGGVSGNTFPSTSGVASFTSLAYNRAETVYFRAHSGGLVADCSIGVTVNPGSPTSIRWVTAPPANAVADQSFAPSPAVELVDNYNNRVTTSFNDITLSSWQDSSCSTTPTTPTVLTATTNPVTPSSGVSTFSNVQFNEAATIYVKAEAVSVGPILCSQVIVAAGTPDRLIYTISPSSAATAGNPFGQQPTVAVVDIHGNTVPTNAYSVSLSAHTGAGCTTASTGTFNATATPTSSGIASFSGVNHEKAETIYVRASAGALTPACSGAITVSASFAAKLAFVVQPSSGGTAGVALGNQPQVQVHDGYNNLVSSGSFTASLTAYTDASCSVLSSGASSGLTATVSGGNANFTSLTHNKAETVYFEVSGNSLVTDCSDPVTIIPNSATTITWQTAPPSTAFADQDFSPAPQVLLTDAYNNVATGASNQVTLSSWQDAGCSTTPTSPFSIGAAVNPVTPSSGVASFANVQYNGAETIYVRASAAGIVGSICSQVIVGPGSPAKLSFSTYPPTSAVAGVDFVPQPIVNVEDIHGNLATTSVSVSLEAHTVPGCSSLSSGTFNASPASSSGGQATFSGVNHTRAETIYVRAFASGLTEACSSVATVVGPDSPTTLDLAGPTTGTTTDCLAYSVTSKDDFNNDSPAPAAISVNFGSSPGVFHSNASCSSAITGVSIAASTTTATFYYEDSSTGTRTIQVASAGYNGDTILLTLSLPTLLVEPVYTTNSNWNDYIQNSNLALEAWEQADTACTGTETSVTECIHAAIYKKVVTPETGSCGSWSATDSNNWFEWDCDDTGANIEFYTTGLADGIGLADLINGTGNAWKPNFVTINVGGNTYNSDPLAWWSNSVQVASDNSSSSVVSLTGVGTIYTIPASRQSRGYNIADDKVALVVLNDEVLTLADGSGRNCDSSTGTVNTSTGQVCLLAMGAISPNYRKFIWVEGNFDGGAVSLPAVSNTIIASRTRLSKFFNVKVQNAVNQGIYTANSNYNDWQKISVSNSDSNGMMVYSSSGNVISGLRAFNNSGNGLGLSFSNQNLVKQSILSSNAQAGLFIGSSSESNNIVNVTASNNELLGFDLDGPGISQTFLNTLAVNNGKIGMRVALGTDADRFTTFVNTALIDNGTANTGDTGLSIIRSGYNRFMGSFINSNFHDPAAGAGDCYVAAGTSNPGLYDQTCTNSGNLGSQGYPTLTGVTQSNALLNPSPGSISAQFGGRVTVQDSTNASNTLGTNSYVSIFDFIFFDNDFRGWGAENTATFPNSLHRGRCASGSCRIWDWRLNSTVDVVRANTVTGNGLNSVFTNGVACPAQLDGSQYALSLTTGPAEGEAFLKHATEDLGDYIGDDDGLCESDEVCHYAPNYGAYQGSGQRYAESCIFSGSIEVDNVELYSRPGSSNGF